MLKYMFSLFLFIFYINSLNALEISLDSAKENFQVYSTLHLKDDNRFLCEKYQDEFEVVTQVVCAFSKKPSQNLKTLENNFFTIDSKIQNKTFFLIIKPKYKIDLFPMAFNLTQDDEVYQANVKLSNHWMVVAYVEKLPLINKEVKSDNGINFPFIMKKDKLPYVGGLDIKGNPVHIKKVQDVTDYLKIKKYYEDEKYDDCLELIDEVMIDYPNSLFKAELLFYKIKVYAKLKDYDNLISLSKIYLAQYSSDENVAEVLSLTANAYALIGLNIDADYFFDRLFSEHKDSVYTLWGYIYQATMLESSGSSTKAIAYYLKALNETDDIDVAATAAYKLALYYSGTTKLDEAANYAMKIVNAKPSFFMNELKKSISLMYLFADEGDYISASAIAKAITDATDKNYDEYERLLRDRAIWLTRTPQKKEALEAINVYIKEYKYGDYEEEIKVAKDSLFFDLADDNVSYKLQEYNKLIDEYTDDSIGNKAIYEKAKLLLENKMYGDVLAIKDFILELDEDKYPDTQEIVKEAAKGSMKLYLEARECQEVLNISHDYNITLSDEWDDGIYSCAMKGGDFLLSKRIATKNLKTKNLDERKKWLYRYIKVDFSTGNYSDVIGASKDLISLIEDDINLEENKAYKDVYRYIFDTYQRLEEDKKMLNAILDIQEVFGQDYKDIERYVAIMGIGSELKDDNIVIKYAQEVMSIQNSSQSYAQSPYVEFTLYQSYINTENLNKALEVIKSADTINLSNEDRARQKYLLGSVYTKLWRDAQAKKAYEDSVEADANSAWAKLAKSALEI